MPKISQLPVSAIEIIPDISTIDQHHLGEIKESIKNNDNLGNGYRGVLTPVKIYHAPPRSPEKLMHRRYWVLDGTYCVYAFEMLYGSDARIRCDVYGTDEVISWDHADIIRIDSNLVRRDRDILERGDLIAKRDEILTKIGLRARPGDNQHTIKTGTATVAVPDKTIKTTKELAQELNLSERSLYLSKQLATKIHEDLKLKIRDAGLASDVRSLSLIARSGADLDSQSQMFESIRQQREEHEKARQRELQDRDRRAKAKTSRSSGGAQSGRKSSPSNVISMRREKPPVSAVLGEWWQLTNKHDVWCGATAGGPFAEYAPECALAIAPLLSLDEDRAVWNHDWLIEKADIVVVPTVPGAIVPFIETKNMEGYQSAFSCWLFDGNKPAETITVFLYSKLMHEIKVPKVPNKIYSMQDLMHILISSYSQSGDLVVCPFISDELIQIASQLGRRTYSGSDRSDDVSRIINGWQNANNKVARKVTKQEIAVV